MSDDLPLGRPADYPNRYDPAVLRRIERRVARERIGLGHPLPFTGEDVWNCYELSWLSPSGPPRIGVLEVRVPAESPNIVESKSLKIYLNGFGGETFDDATDPASVIEADLSRETGAEVRVSIRAPQDLPLARDFTSFCLDELAVAVDQDRCPGELLETAGSTGSDATHTHLFRTTCPITGQPDWGSVAITYRGRLLHRASVLRYLVSYRNTADFHEVVAERTFVDLLAATDATDLTVDFRFLRRGGIDINPFRSTSVPNAPPLRLKRQ